MLKWLLKKKIVGNNNFDLIAIQRNHVESFLRTFPKFYIHPNIITIFAFLLVLLVGIIPLFLHYPATLRLIPLYFFIGYMDLLDGSMARKHKKVSKYGGWMDTLSSLYSDYIFILCALIYVINNNSFIYQIIGIFAFASFSIFKIASSEYGRIKKKELSKGMPNKPIVITRYFFHLTFIGFAIFGYLHYWLVYVLLYSIGMIGLQHWLFYEELR